MNVMSSIEETKEFREVTVTLGFEMVDGKCVNAEDQAIYDLVAPVGDEIITPVEGEENTDGDNPDYMNG